LSWILRLFLLVSLGLLAVAISTIWPSARMTIGWMDVAGVSALGIAALGVAAWTFSAWLDDG
jgi:hypothetical protein